MNVAEKIARRFHHDTIDTTPLLLGILQEDGRGECIAIEILRQFDVQMKKLGETIETTIGMGDEHITTVYALTPAAKKAIELAVIEVRSMGHQYVGTHHLLLALVRQQQDITSQILQSYGVTLTTARIKTSLLLATKPSPRISFINKLRKRLLRTQSQEQYLSDRTASIKK